jgi:hypothetical protein
MAPAERSSLALRRVPAADLFRAAFCACAGDARPLLLDTRPRGAFARGHVAGAYCVRVSANAAALLDYSGGGQEQPWSAGAWWGKPLLLYGGDDAAEGGADGASAADGTAAEATLSATHPVVAFLLAEGRASSVTVVVGGCVRSASARSAEMRSAKMRFRVRTDARALCAVRAAMPRCLARTPSCAPPAARSARAGAAPNSTPYWLAN